MPAVTSPEQLFEHELQDIYYAEKTLTKVLPKLADEAKDRELSRAFTSHLKETEKHLNPAFNVLFVCTHNSARSQLAAALWSQLTDQSAESAGTHPAERVHRGAVAAARRAGLDLSEARPKLLEDVADRPALVVTVCDRAHEELDPDPTWLHWSVPDPVAAPSRAAFDTAVAELRDRITHLVAAS